MAMRLPEGEGSHPLTDVSSKPGRGIILATGLLAPALYVRRLRNELTEAGYDAHGVHYPKRINTGTPDVAKAIREKAEKIRETKDQPLAGVGYSWGGVQLFDLACEKPDLMDFVVTVGSPSRLTLRKKPPEITVISFVGGNGGFWDLVVPSGLAHRPDDNDSKNFRQNHYRLPFSRRVSTTIIDLLGSPNGNKQQAPLTVVR